MIYAIKSTEQPGEVSIRILGCAVSNVRISLAVSIVGNTGVGTRVLHSGTLMPSSELDFCDRESMFIPINLTRFLSCTGVTQCRPHVIRQQYMLIVSLPRVTLYYDQIRIVLRLYHLSSLDM